MLLQIAADVVVIVHLIFILFAVLGGLLVLRWRWLAVLHLPAVVWGATVEFTGWICPLTPLENTLRRAAGESDYGGGFTDQYLIPIIYPPGLTPDIQVLLGAVVVIVNLGAYGYLAYRRRWVKRARRQASSADLR